MRKTKDGLSQYAVIEVTPDIYKAVTRSEKLYIGYNRCSVKNYIPVTRCYNCCGYGHVASECRMQKRCSQCAEEHELKVCSKDKMECTNCKQFNFKMANRYNFRPCETNHTADSEHCPTYKKIVEIIKSRINYG